MYNCIWVLESLLFKTFFFNLRCDYVHGALINLCVIYEGKRGNALSSFGLFSSSPDPMMHSCPPSQTLPSLLWIPPPPSPLHFRPCHQALAHSSAGRKEQSAKMSQWNLPLMLSIPSAALQPQTAELSPTAQQGLHLWDYCFHVARRHSNVPRLLSYIWLLCTIYKKRKKSTRERKITSEVNASI